MSQRGTWRIGGAGMLALTLVAGGCAPAATAGGGARPSDAEVVAIALVANEGEVQTSQPAVSNASSSEVRQFAQRMVTEHTAAAERLRALGIPPQQNDLSRQLTQSAQETARILQGYSGAALDRAYMDGQIQMHQYTLNNLDNYLIPSARNGALRAELQGMRGAVVMHLEQARQIRGQLGS